MFLLCISFILIMKTCCECNKRRSHVDARCKLTYWRTFNTLQTTEPFRNTAAGSVEVEATLCLHRPSLGRKGWLGCVVVSVLDS